MTGHPLGHNKNCPRGAPLELLVSNSKSHYIVSRLFDMPDISVGKGTTTKSKDAATRGLLALLRTEQEAMFFSVEQAPNSSSPCPLSSSLGPPPGSSGFQLHPQSSKGNGCFQLYISCIRPPKPTPNHTKPKPTPKTADFTSDPPNRPGRAGKTLRRTKCPDLCVSVLGAGCNPSAGSNRIRWEVVLQLNHHPSRCF